jgi:hypothetical protein
MRKSSSISSTVLFAERQLLTMMPPKQPVRYQMPAAFTRLTSIGWKGEWLLFYFMHRVLCSFRLNVTTQSIGLPKCLLGTILLPKSRSTCPCAKSALYR